MKKIISGIVICTVAFFYLCGCNSGIKNRAQTEKNTAETQSFFPVTDFLLGQLVATDSLPVTPLKITITGNHRDSVWLKKEDLRKHAIPFLQPVIDSVSMAKYFTEKSFLDQTINAVTLSYDANSRLPDSIKFNHWDIYIDPQKHNVQRVYLVKEENLNGEKIVRQLTWKVDKWFSIRTIVQPLNKSMEVKEEIVKWDVDE